MEVLLSFTLVSNFISSETFPATKQGQKNETLVINNNMAAKQI